MKKRYKSLISCLAATLLCLNVFISGNAEAVSDKMNTAVSALFSLNIMRGYEDGSLHTEKQVSRIEFVTMVLRAIEADDMMGSLAQTNSFSDVANDFWGAGAAEAAVAMGLINGYGDGRFGPNDSVTMNQAIKIMVSALGYRDAAEQQGGYPNGYLKAASSLGILKNLKSGEMAASRGEVALLIYDSLTVSLLEDVTFGSDGGKKEKSENTLLSNMGIKVISTVVTGVYGASMNGNQTDKNEIELSGKLYESCVDAAAFFGLKVNAWILDDDSNYEGKVLHLQLKEEDSLIIEADMIDDSTTKDIIKYYKNGSLKSVTLEEPSVVIYNGSTLNSEQREDAKYLKPENGRVIVREKDGGSTVIVWDYKSYILTGTGEDVLYDLYGRQIKIPDKGSVTILSNNASLKVEELKGGDVLWVAESLDEKMLRCEVGGNVISGVLEGISTDSGKTVYTIEGEEHILAGCYTDALDRGHQKAQKLSLGDYAQFTLDLGGHVVAAEPSEESKTKYYGYLVAAELGKGIEKKLTLQIMTQNNSFENIELKKGASIRFGRVENGNYIVNRADKDTIWKCIGGDNATKKQLIQYETDDSGKIKVLYLADNVANRGDFSMDAPQQKMTYAGGVLNQKYFLKSDTPVFYVPNSGRYEEQFYATTASKFFANRSEHTVIVYDIENLYAGAVVVVTNNENIYVDSTGLETYISMTNSPVMLIDKSSVQLNANEDGSEYLVLSGYVGKKYTQVLVSDTISSNSNAWKDLKPGNVIQYETNDVILERAKTSDYDKVMVIYSKLFDCNQINQETFQTWNYKNNINVNASISTAYGVISEYDLPYLTVRLNRNLASGQERDVEVPMVLSGGTAVLRYEGSNKKAELLRIEDLAVGQKVFIRQRYNNVREVIILE
mgnify:CR=1 FL=1